MDDKGSMDSLDIVSPYLFTYKRRNFIVQDQFRPKDLDAVQHFELRQTDVLLITYPKSGSVWMQQITVQIMDEAHPEQAEDVSNNSRVPWLEEMSAYDPNRVRPDPRIFSTHLPPDMLSLAVKDKQIKAVYVWRNSKDVLVSFYHFAQSCVHMETPKSFEDFFQQFLDGKGSMDSLDLVSPYLFTYKKRNFMVKDQFRPKDFDAVQHFELRPTDVLLITYPKSGSVWMQQITVQIMDEAHPEQTEDASNRSRVPWLEERSAGDPNRVRPDPRIFSTHLPPDMLPLAVKDKQIKAVYVWRNPKDVLVSFYHFAQSCVPMETPKSFEDFFQQFLDGKVYMGSWFDHVSEYSAALNQLNIHFVQYENLLKDLRGEVVKLCSFLGEDLTDEAIDRVVESSTFKNMKTNPNANYMELLEKERYKKETMRKGVAGDWKNHLTVAQNQRFDEVLKEKMKTLPLTCIWEMGSMDSLDLVSPYLFTYKKRNFLVKDKLRPNDLDTLQHFELRPTDVFLITYPKSGTVWMQQIVVQIMDEAHPELAEDASNRSRVPWLEERSADDPNRERPDPRIFGTHLPPDMLPLAVKDKQIKAVYVWRNPKDVLVSLYHFAQSWVLLETPKSFQDFFQQFLDGKVYMGSWFDHVSEYSAARNQLNIHFVQYENLLKDLRGEVVKLCSFLGQDLTDEAIDRVVESSTFKNMKTNPNANYMELLEKERYKKETMRKGVAGDWKNHLTVAQNQRFDEVLKEKMKTLPLTCIWEMGSMDSLDLVSPYLFTYKKRNFLVKDKLRPNDLNTLQHFELRPTDVFLITYPKSGTVWMQQIVVQIMDEAHPEQAEDASNRIRVPWLEERSADDPNRERPDPRIFGTHLPPDMLPLAVKDKQIKAVYVWRNPKDVLVSLYHFAQSWVLLETPKSFEEFFQQFLDGKVYMGSWFDHVSEYSAAQNQLNIHFVQYENLLKDLRGEVVKICSFLGQDLTDEAIDRVVESSTFKNMKTNPNANYKEFIEKDRYKKETMRKGVAGDWKNHLTVAQNQRFDEVLKEKMKTLPLTCIWEMGQ